MNKVVKTSVVAFAMLALAGCAQVGAGLQAPTPKEVLLGKNNVVPSAAALTIAAAAGNAQAQVDYAALALYCEGKAPVPSAMLTNEYAIQASQFGCEVYGYTNSDNQLIVPTTVPLGPQPASTVPTASSSVK